MIQNRPKNLNLLSIRFPVTAISSILHRISGVVLFLALPLLLWMLDQSLQGQAAFDALKACVLSPYGIIFTWIVTVAYFYHIVAGVRHILMDIGIGESLSGGKAGAWIVILLSLAFAIWYSIMCLGAWA